MESRKNKNKRVKALSPHPPTILQVPQDAPHQEPILEKTLGDLKILVSCRVCMRPMYEPYTIACGHTCCYSCLTQWFENNRGRKTCPDCRAVVREQPAPAYLVKEIIHLFLGRAELLADGETLEEIRTAQQEEAKVVEDDKTNQDPRHGGLFRGCFASPRRVAVNHVIEDYEDGVTRCPHCAWELEGGFCTQCEVSFGDSEMDSDFSDDVFHSVLERANLERSNWESLGVATFPHLHAGRGRSPQTIGFGHADPSLSDEDASLGSTLASDEEDYESSILDSAGSLDDFVEDDVPPPPFRVTTNSSPYWYDRGSTESMTYRRTNFSPSNSDRGHDLNGSISDYTSEEDEHEHTSVNDEVGSDTETNTATRVSTHEQRPTRKRRRVVNDSSDESNSESDVVMHRPRSRRRIDERHQGHPLEAEDHPEASAAAPIVIRSSPEAYAGSRTVPIPRRRVRDCVRERLNTNDDLGRGSIATISSVQDYPTVQTAARNRNRGRIGDHAANPVSQERNLASIGPGGRYTSSHSDTDDNGDHETPQPQEVVHGPSCPHFEANRSIEAARNEHRSLQRLRQRQPPQYLLNNPPPYYFNASSYRDYDPGAPAFSRHAA